MLSNIKREIKLDCYKKKRVKSYLLQWNLESDKPCSLYRRSKGIVIFPPANIKFGSSSVCETDYDLELI